MSVTSDDLLCCLDCGKPVNIALLPSGTCVTCPCGKFMPTDQFDAEGLEIDPVAPDAWEYGDPNE